MFRLQDNVPNVYIDESRDFQLLCRLYDSVNNGVRFDITSMLNILDPFKASDRVLELLATRVGFFPKYSYDSRLMRYIISAFPYLIKNKGSKSGIEAAVATILKVDGIVDTPRIIIDNDEYIIRIYTGTKIYNKTALKDVLSYIVPVGYTFYIEEVTYSTDSLSNIVIQDSISLLYNPSVSNSQLRGSDRVLGEDTFDFEDEFEDNYVGSYITTEVIGSTNNSNAVTDETGSEIDYEDDRNLIDANTIGFMESDGEVTEEAIDFVNENKDISN